MPASHRETVTACLIVRDEADRLPRALASVAFCDEIVVVDSGSLDDTVAIARAAGATVVERGWPGFAAQRNVALDHAHGDWILEVDADERVTPGLRTEIEAFLAGPPSPDLDMAALPRRDNFLGGTLGPSSKYPNYRYRLFRRGSYRHDERRTVHEGLKSTRPVVAFEHDLEHDLAGSWREAVTDTWAYARLDSLQAPSAGSGLLATAKGAVARPAAKLAYRTVVEGGWRDGWRGLARIGLECAADATVAVRLARRGADGTVPEGDGLDEPDSGSPPRVLAVAAGPAATAEAVRWLDDLRQTGTDTGILTDAAPPVGPHHVRRLDHIGPLTLVRALDAEKQLREVDAIVPFGARATRCLRVVPPRLRGSGSPPAPAPAGSHAGS